MAAARAFVRSLNILLKFARLYGFDHARTAAQLATAWDELRAAVPKHTESGLLLGTSGTQLLVDGVPLDSSATERSFAQLLSAAGVASIHFSPEVTVEDLGHLVRAFPAANTKSSVVADQLRAALAHAVGIRINEVRFVAEDAAFADARTAAALTAKAMGADAEQFKSWLNDPQKLLQLIAAAQGSHAGPGGGSGAGEPGAGGPAGSSPATPFPAGVAGGSTGLGGGLTVGPGEEELLGILKLLSRLGNSFGAAGSGSGDSGSGQVVDPGVFQQEVSKLGPRAQITLRDALASVAAHASGRRPDEAVLVRLAEHLAIRFALDRYERGEIRVNAVRQMLERMNQEIDALRKVLGSHEDKMARAGMIVESHAELLDRQFWAAVPESGKRGVLLSPEAWCIPPRNVRHYAEELINRGDLDLARKILLNYSSRIASSDAEARKRTAIGVCELADLYCTGGAPTLAEAIRQCGAALSGERESELQTLISAAFVRLSQEAASRRLFDALHQTIASLDAIDNQRPAFAEALRPRIALENRIPEFLEQTLRSESVLAGLPEILARMPGAAMQAITIRFSRCRYRNDAARLVALAQQIGDPAISYLRELLRAGQPHEAVDTIALLSRLDLASVEQFLPSRLDDWPRTAHDRAVRQLAAGGAAGRGPLLLQLLDVVDPLVMPIILDELSITGDTACIERLTHFAAGAVPETGGPYLRVKAIEALGRLRAEAAANVLRMILTEHKLLGWVQPEELRIVAAQALANIQPDWMAEFLPKSGLDPSDLSLAALDPAPDSPRIRQRRYARVRPKERISATCHTENDTARLEILALSLGGGMAQTDRNIPPGTHAILKAGSGRQGFKAAVLMRDSRAQIVAFEIVSIEMGERLKLRRLILSLTSAASVETPPLQ